MLGLFIALLLFVFSALHVFKIETPDYESNDNSSRPVVLPISTPIRG